MIVLANNRCHRDPGTIRNAYIKHCRRGHSAHTGLFPSIRQSRVTDPSVDVEFWLGSRITEASVEPPERDTRPKIAWELQKRQTFRSGCRNLGDVMRNFGRCRNVELVKMVTRHPPCRFERKSPVYGTQRPIQ